MAGIGFSLHKILKHDTLTRIIAAYATAGIISSTPWIISILGILILGVFISTTPEYHPFVVQFQISITYIVAGSLMISGFAQNSFSRYVSDQLFLNKDSYVIPNFNGMSLVVTSIAGLFSFLLVLIFFPAQSIGYRLLFMANFVTLSNLWVIVNLLTGLKDYLLIVKAFLVSYLVIVLLGFFLRTFGLEGLMLAYLLGQLLLVILLMVALYRQYPTNRFIEFHCFKKNNIYIRLMISGLLFNVAVWVDKFVFWYSPETSYAVIGPLRGSLFYDVPIFLAYLSVAPGMGVLLFLIETNFSNYYEQFYEAIRSGKSLSYIQMVKNQMISHAYHVIYSIIKIQAVIIILIFQWGDRILSWFHISIVYKNLLYVDVIGTSLQVIFLGILNLLYYMDRRRETLILSGLFLILNTGLSLISIQMGPFYYGFGFTVALAITCTYGMYRLDDELNHLEYKAIMLR
jgi:uncharacterized membrane protein